MWRALKGVWDLIVFPVVLPVLLNRWLATSRDQKRADIISVIADNIAARVVRDHPDSEPAKLVDAIVSELVAAIPTNSRQVAYREAWAAVARAIEAAKS